jgi:hypothetical protein
MKTISLTVPMDYNALTRASDMLHGLAIDLSKDKAPDKPVGIVEPSVAAPAPAPAPAVVTEPAATEVFGDPKQSAPSAAPSVTEPATPTQTTSEAPVPTATDAAPSGVDLDGEGLPGDHRIHASSKAKLAKKPHGWKRKRGVDDALVAEVEAELRAAMAAGTGSVMGSSWTPAPVGNVADTANTQGAVSPAPAPAGVASVDTVAAPAPAPTAATTATVTPANPDTRWRYYDVPGD